MTGSHFNIESNIAVVGINPIYTVYSSLGLPYVWLVYRREYGVYSEGNGGQVEVVEEDGEVVVQAPCRLEV